MEKRRRVPRVFTLRLFVCTFTASAPKLAAKGFNGWFCVILKLYPTGGRLTERDLCDEVALFIIELRTALSLSLSPPSFSSFYTQSSRATNCQIFKHTPRDVYSIKSIIR